MDQVAFDSSESMTLDAPGYPLYKHLHLTDFVSFETVTKLQS